MKTQLTGVLTALALLNAAMFAQGPAKFHRMIFRKLNPYSGGQPNALISGRRLTPPTFADCVAFGELCYSPMQIRHAYGLSPLLEAGYTGKGETIVIIDSFGSPTVLNDLQQFDLGYGLPDPPSFKVLSPLGTVPFDPTDLDMLGWAEETSLDVQWAHAIAPDASIVLLTSPVSATEGTQGLPEFLQLEQYAVDNQLGKIVSQSWAVTENNLFTPAGTAILNSFNAFYAAATTNAHITFLAASGDSGSANVDINGNLYSFPAVGFPASSPWVTAVGGTSLYADSQGNYQSETVWNNPAYGAGGGGVSQYFAEPFYQQLSLPGVQKTLNHHRGLPDVAYDADPLTGVLVYLSFLGPENTGYYLFGGTSSGSPQWAGVIAIANQYLGHPLGFINPALYLLGRANLDYFFLRDVNLGNNSFDGIPGYEANAGWDPATGWGTPDLGKLICDLGNLR